MALDISKITQSQLPDNCYFNQEVEKSQLYIHHTAGGSNPFNVVNGWKTNANKICTAFIIGGKPSAVDKHKDGEIVQAFSSKKWGYHLGLKSNHFAPFGLPYKELNSTSIGIELTNWGYLTKDAAGNFKTYLGKTVPSDEVIELDKPYRNYKFYHRYTDAQLASLRDLLIYLCDKYNIPKTFHADMFELNKNALSGVKGIFTHTSVRPDKWDCPPQPNLIKILQTLTLNTI